MRFFMDEIRPVKKFRDDSLTEFIAETCLNTEGTASMASVDSDDMAEGILNKAVFRKGVMMVRGKSGLVFDIYVNVVYGARIPVVAWNLQEEIKKAIESNTSETVSRVNIHVKGVQKA